MYGFLEAFAKWLENTFWAIEIRTTSIYPFIQLLHFTGLSLWLGTNILVDLRLLGVGRKNQTAAELSSALLPWNWIAFAIVVLGGFSLFSSTASLYLVNSAFRLKLGLFVPAALIWHIIVQRKARTWGQEMSTPAVAKLGGLLEIALWLCVVTAAVEIPSY